MKTISKQRLVTTVTVILGLTLAGCDSNDYPTDSPAPPPPPVVDNSIDFSYEVTVTNLTESQPLSPIALVSHGDIKLWSIGESADDALELLAESGDNSDVLANAELYTAEGGAGVILPGMNETITINTRRDDAPLLSIVTMLVNTNDAFTGKTAINVSNLAIGDSMMMATVAYDAGSEGNSESAGTIPGPADGGEGYNMMRDDVDYVAYHPGVVSNDDGLMASILSAEHKFDNPVMRVVITRLQ